jgi:hypothetical protein
MSYERKRCQEPYVLRFLTPFPFVKHCVRYHDGSAGTDKSPLVLTGEPKGDFSRSYNSLKAYLRWYEWGGKSISGVATLPGTEKVSGTLRLKVPDTFSVPAQAAQKRGEAVVPPEVQ